MSRLVHLTAVTHMRSRRITGQSGARYQLCGAEPTDRDVLARDFNTKYAAWAKENGFHICPQCVERAKEDSK